MQKRILYIWLLMAWMLCGCGCMVSSAYAYDQNAQSASWGYKPVNTAIPTKGTLPDNGRYSRTYSPVFDQDVSPTFNFQSTSPYSSPVGSASSGMTTQSGPRRASGFSWDDPEDDPIGVLPNIPVGEPLVLLMMALLYVLYRMHKRRVRDARTV